MGRRDVFRKLIEQDRADRKEAKRLRGPAKIATMPHCVACGTSVPEAGTMCPDCTNRRPPQPMFQTAPQPVPAYDQRGQFRKLQEGEDA